MSEDAVTTLHTAAACENIVSALRSIADQVEAGEFGPLSAGALVLAKASKTPPDKHGYFYERLDHACFGFGPRNDRLTFLGLMALGASEPEGTF